MNINFQNDYMPEGISGSRQDASSIDDDKCAVAKDSSSVRCLASFVLYPFGDVKITSTSTERQKRSQNVSPVLVIISWNSLVSSRKIIASTAFYRCCAPGASAPVVVKIQSPNPLLADRCRLDFLGF